MIKVILSTLAVGLLACSCASAPPPVAPTPNVTPSGPPPIGYLGVLMGYMGGHPLSNPEVVGFTETIQECLDKGRKLVENLANDAAAAGVTLNVACVPVPPAPPAPPPTSSSSSSVPPSTTL